MSGKRPAQTTSQQHVANVASVAQPSSPSNSADAIPAMRATSLSNPATTSATQTPPSQNPTADVAPATQTPLRFDAGQKTPAPSAPAVLRLFSWNVNGLRAVLRKNACQGFLARYHPDIFCLQETKMRPDQAELDLPDYDEFWHSAERPGYAGVAVFSKVKPLRVYRNFELIAGQREKSASQPTRQNTQKSADRPARQNAQVSGSDGEPTAVKAVDNLPAGQNVREFSGDAGQTALKATDNFSQPAGQETAPSVLSPTPLFSRLRATLAADPYGDPLREGRLLTLEFPAFFLVNVYTPNAKPDLSRLPLRRDTWDPLFAEYLRILQTVKPVLACGDFNVAHAEIDLARPEANHRHAGFTDEERAGMTHLLGSDLIDTFRATHPDAQRYTWWSHWGNARARNVGWRIDYFLASAPLTDALTDAEIYETQLGSDHCPVSVTLNLRKLNNTASTVKTAKSGLSTVTASLTKTVQAGLPAETARPASSASSAIKSTPKASADA